MGKLKILVIGDIMIDKYVFVDTTRNASEARIPVWDFADEQYRLGGAANVANNLQTLGGDDVEVFLAGIVDVKTRVFIQTCGINVDLCAGSETMFKTRFVKNSDEIILRYDNMKSFDACDHEFFMELLKHYSYEPFDAVVVSDYDKGTITPEVMKIVNSFGVKPVIVDSKRRDLTMFQGNSVLKINEHEYSIQSSSSIYPYVEGLFDYVVVTLGEDGADLRQCEMTKSNQKRYVVHRENFPTKKAHAKDVTGCGDTHTAALCFSLLKNGGDIRMAIRFANACASRVVQKFGTSVVNDIPSVV